MIDSLATNVERLKRITGASKGCGWMYDEVAFLVYSLVKFYKPDLVIQTGHLWGKSACVILEALTDGFLAERGGLEVEPQDSDHKFSTFVREHSPQHNPKSRMISIDPWPHLMKVDDPYGGIELLTKLYPGRFEFHKMKSGEFFANHFKEDVSHLRLMGIVDGDHTPEGCLLDLENFGKLKAQVILVDDTNWLPELKPVTKKFADDAGYAFMNFEPYNGVAILTKHK
jgi:hypothetical protein